jgi:predicted RNase H-like nuclease
MAIAVDGSRFCIDNGDCGIEFLTRITELQNFPHSLAMVDIPIGLPESGKRNCDIEARKLLGRNWPRVFSDARRGLLNFEGGEFEAANLWAKSNGAGISRQLFAIIPKMAEVDRFVDTKRQSVLRETHPELIFLRLNGTQPLPNKKTRGGIELRRHLIRDQGISEID